MTTATKTLSDTIGTRQPFDLSDELSARVQEVGIQSQVDQMQKEGYTIIPDIATPEFTARLRETCKRMTQETDAPLKGVSAALLLGRDPIYEEVVLNPKILALVEVMCGKGALLSQLITSVRPEGSTSLTLHADQGWMPAPFPKHNYLLTMCWTMDEYTLEGGCTKVIPKTHLHRRHPNKEETQQETGAIPLECPPNSLTCWDGSIWHGNYPRQIEGERVVLHTTFSRLAMRPVENYDHLDDKWLDGKPHELSIMLGREDFLGSSTIARGFADFTKLPKTFEWAKT